VKTNNNRQALIEQVKADILNKNVCPDLAQTATNLVMGDGNVNAELVFVGEAPGKNEDLRGLPFVGAAGKFLDELLASVSLDRADVYITNIVKYRPPGNRDPLPVEKQAFWPYLIRQLEIINPKIVVTLGRHSMEYFLPGRTITEVHAQPKRVVVGKSKIVILPLYHPAAALYNGSLRSTLMEDFQVIPVVLNKINESK